MAGVLKLAPASTSIRLLARDGSLRGHSLVDAADAEWLSQWTWRLHASGYVCRGTRASGEFVLIWMHRALLGLEVDVARRTEVDHVNHDRLDNRRANLRIVTRAMNRQNVVSRNGSSSQFRGVSWNVACSRWEAFCHIDGRKYHLGVFESEEEAGRVAAAFRAEHLPGAIEELAA